MRDAGIPIKEIIARLGVSRGTVKKDIAHNKWLAERALEEYILNSIAGRSHRATYYHSRALELIDDQARGMTSHQMATHGEAADKSLDKMMGVGSADAIAPLGVVAPTLPDLMGTFHLPGIFGDGETRPYTMPRSRYWKGDPYPKQLMALAALSRGDVTRMLYGGAAGGGKSELACMLAVQYVDHPAAADWNVLLVAASWDQHKAGALPRLEDALADDIASGLVHYNRQDRDFRFKSGARIRFAIYPPDGNMHKKFGGSEYACICVDEAGELPAEALEYLPTRLGRKDTVLPNAYLLTSNPLGQSFLHLFETYYDAPQGMQSYYLSARVEDNPSIPQAYIDALDELAEPQRTQLRLGLWTVTGAGVLWPPEVIKRARAAYAEDPPALADMRSVCIGVDPSGSVKSSSSECGIVVAGRDARTGRIVVLDDWSERLEVSKWPDRIAELARQYVTVDVVFESNFGGRLGPQIVKNAGQGQYLQVHSIHTDRGKYERAAPVGVLYARGEVAHADGLDILERHMSSFTPESVKRTDRIDAAVYAILFVDGTLDQLGKVEVI